MPGITKEIDQGSRPDWLKAEQQRLQDTPVSLPQRDARPTIGEVAIRQLKKEALRESLVSCFGKFSGPEEINVRTINKIIDKVVSL